MKRSHVALLVVAAAVLIWTGWTRDTSAQTPPAPPAPPVPGRYMISTVQSGSGSWTAFILDTQTGQTWYRESRDRGDRLRPLAGPVGPLTAERPAAPDASSP